MVQLTEEQEATIWQALQGSHNRLIDELYDHCCCAVEARIATGETFEASLSTALQNLAPRGVTELEAELDFMMTFQPLTRMKRLFYLSTFVGTFFLCFSILAKSWNWQDGTAITQLAGNSTLLLFVIPSTIALSIRNWSLLNKLDVFRLVTGVSAGLLICFGMIFKTLSFPMANSLFNWGMVLLLFVFLPVFFLQLYRRAYL